jgi:hypothetical protein
MSLPGIPDVTGLNTFFSIASNGPFIQEIGKRVLVTAAGLGMVGIGFALSVAGTKAGQLAGGVAASVAEGVATDGASVVAKGAAGAVKKGKTHAG